jgi:hypothetical protein
LVGRVLKVVQSCPARKLKQSVKSKKKCDRKPPKKALKSEKQSKRFPGLSHEETTKSIPKHTEEEKHRIEAEIDRNDMYP